MFSEKFVSRSQLCSRLVELGGLTKVYHAFGIARKGNLDVIRGVLGRLYMWGLIVLGWIGFVIFDLKGV